MWLDILLSFGTSVLEAIGSKFLDGKAKAKVTKEFIKQTLYQFLNCQIKLEKNYMLICNVLHEYF